MFATQIGGGKKAHCSSVKIVENQNNLHFSCYKKIKQ